MGTKQAASTNVDRERFIQTNMSLIRQTAISQTGRVLQWGRDEELSIALIAFDTALDTHQPEKGMDFIPYAKMIIRRRLVDYYRSQVKRSRELPVGDVINDLAENPDFAQGELESYLTMQRKDEIQLLIAKLRELQIELEDLIQQAPRQRLLRSKLSEAAKQISANKPLHIRILKSGRMPLHEVSEMTKISQAVLSKRKKYLLALLTIEFQSADFPFIRTYLDQKEDNKNENTSSSV